MEYQASAAFEVELARRLAETDSGVLSRRYRWSDAPTVWALNDIPHIGNTADPNAPLPLREVDTPPSEFPHLGDITRHFLDTSGEFLVGELDGHIVTMGGIRPNNDVQAEVKHIRVHPALRRRGLGSALMSALEAVALERGFRELHLDTAAIQPEAVVFYRSLGYDEVGQETRPEWAWTLVYFVKKLDST
jgi:GNAT superfamily N-acetyltransferase